MAAETTEHLDELLPGYAAGAADAAERGRVEAHVAGCLRCRRLMDDYLEAVHSLALLPPSVAPPLRVRSALLRALPRRRRPAFSWAAAWAAGVAASLVAALGLGAGLAFLGLRAEVRQTRAATAQLEELLRQDRLVAYLAASPETEVYLLKAAQEGERAYGMVMGAPAGRFALLVAGGLADPGPGRVYQVWLTVDGERTSGGTFAVDAVGWGQARLQPAVPLAQVRRVGVTVEPAGGSPVPTASLVLAWARP